MKSLVFPGLRYVVQALAACAVFIFAAGAAHADTGDTAWILTSTALVLFMTLPGLALFYGGLVRSINILSVLMHCFAIACLISILWLVVGYSIAFGDGNGVADGAGQLWGGLSKAFLSGVNVDDMSGTIPEVLFFMFQMTFAVITPALIVGAYVERVKFSAVLKFSAGWLLLVYAPVCHWIWGWRLACRYGRYGLCGRAGRPRNCRYFLSCFRGAIGITQEFPT